MQVRPFNASPVTRPSPPLLLSGERLDIEIGCGVGWHAIQRAKQYPNHNIVAIEHTRTRFEKFARRLERHQLPNLQGVHADAISWVANNLSKDSVENLFILYPNPYPKKRHLNRRWHAMPFMEKLLEVLKPTGSIVLATNQQWYAAEALQYFEKTWKLCASMRLLDAKTHVPRTHFESKYLARGQACFEVNAATKH